MKNFKTQTLLILSLILTFAFGQAQNNPDFYLASNGVTCMCPDADFGDTGTLAINGEEKTFTKRTRTQLDAIIVANQQDPQIALTCTSGITDMSELFNGKQDFNQDISYWDVSNVTDMSFMFIGANLFNQPLNNWDVSNVTDMSGMFSNASNFNQTLNNWDVSNVTDMSSMFSLNISFNQPLNNWDVSNVTDMFGMFSNALNFNQPLNNWDVSSVTKMTWMFAASASFNQPLDDWDVSNVTNMRGMFSFGEYGSVIFNQPLNNWDVSNVTDMGYMFWGNESFNQPLNNWDVSNVTSMFVMFDSAISFNQPLSNWDVSKVIDMNWMFYSSDFFNQDLSSWCVEQIPIEPSGFATNSALQANFYPNWGADCSLGVFENRLGDFQVYPNPVQNQLFLSWSDPVTQDDIEVSIYDINGKTIINQFYRQKPTSIEVSQLSGGVYFLKVTSGQQSQVRRVIKE